MPDYEEAHRHLDAAEKILDDTLSEATEREEEYYRLGQMRGRGDAIAIVIAVGQGSGSVEDVRNAIVDLIQADKGM